MQGSHRTGGVGKRMLATFWAKGIRSKIVQRAALIMQMIGEAIPVTRGAIPDESSLQKDPGYFDTLLV
eukprot:6469857-Amphidinium_carterae.1